MSTLPLTNSYYDIRPAVLRGDLEHGKIEPYASSMSDSIQNCDTSLPNGMCMITKASPLSYKKAVETLAFYFVRELKFDRPPFTASEYSNRVYYPPSQRTNDANTRSFLWFNEREGFPGHWETFGACSFRLNTDIWRLGWVWIHPFERRKGHFQAAWPFFRSMFGVFVPDTPISSEMVAFLKKIGYPQVVKEYLEERKMNNADSKDQG